MLALGIRAHNGKHARDSNVSRAESAPTPAYRTDADSLVPRVCYEGSLTATPQQKVNYPSLTLFQGVHPQRNGYRSYAALTSSGRNGRFVTTSSIRPNVFASSGDRNLSRSTDFSIVSSVCPVWVT